MKVFDKISTTQDWLQKQKSQGLTVGFVPTMGALHQGHLDLMRRAREQNDILAVSVFVNPIQFNNPEDLEKYPRDLDRDRNLLLEVGCDLLFAPEVGEMYPDKVDKQFDFGPLETVMEGAFRSGHFNGVAVVVEKLFQIIRPDRAYFGEKDFQQLAIIRRLVDMENLDVTIVSCPTVRETDGLAMSSRNERLTAAEREEAPFIYETLQKAKQKAKHMQPDEIRFMVQNMFGDQPDFKLEYFEIAEEENLQPVGKWPENKAVRGFIAAQLGKVRLIDNMRLIPEPQRQ
jgi:pantoate--beta-alanine ligase